MDELDFEWSPEEELECYCQRILKNVAEEEMTPRQRFEATMEGRARDRLLLETLYFNLYAVRTLDSAADALEPVGVCRNTKIAGEGASGYLVSLLPRPSRPLSD